MNGIKVWTLSNQLITSELDWKMNSPVKKPKQWSYCIRYQPQSKVCFTHNEHNQIENNNMVNSPNYSYSDFSDMIIIAICNENLAHENASSFSNTIPWRLYLDLYV